MPRVENSNSHSSTDIESQTTGELKGRKVTKSDNYSCCSEKLLRKWLLPIPIGFVISIIGTCMILGKSQTIVMTGKILLGTGAALTLMGFAIVGVNECCSYYKT